MPLVVSGESIRPTVVRFDSYEGRALEGKPEDLLSDWQRRLALKIDGDGEIVPENRLTGGGGRPLSRPTTQTASDADCRRVSLLRRRQEILAGNAERSLGFQWPTAAGELRQRGEAFRSRSRALAPCASFLIAIYEHNPITPDMPKSRGLSIRDSD